VKSIRDRMNEKATERHELSWPDRQIGITYGIKISKDGQLSHKQGSGPLAGAVAAVESVGEINKRVTATRVVLTGPLALLLKKKRDDRQVFITISGDDYDLLITVSGDAKHQASARRFVQLFNQAAQRAKSL
jgi:hypothetical protein